MELLEYYGVLWRGLGPAGLAEAAARRLRREALRRLPTRSPKPLPHVGSIRTLKDRGGWTDFSRRASVREALRQVPGAAERAVAAARRILDGEMELFGHTVPLPATGVSWSADPLTGQRFGDEVNPKSPPGADPKYPWHLGRLDLLVTLGQGAWASTDDAFQRACGQRFATLLDDFLSSNPAGRGIQWACAMEVALRAANIAQGLLFFAASPEVEQPALLERAVRSLAEHAAYVDRNREDAGAVPNNHLVADEVGVAVATALFPEIPGAARRVLAAESRISELLFSQVHPDGASFEGSVPYHRLALELFTLAYLSARDQGRQWRSAAVDRLGAMFRVAAHACSEQGRAPQLGDNDSGRALPLCARPSLDHGYLAPLGAALLARGDLKHGQYPDEAAWLLGAEGRAVFDALPAAPARRSITLPDAGWAFLRGGGLHVSVSAGPSGQRGVGGHSHNDKLSFELHVQGEPIVVDPGTMTYTRDASVRNAFRATAAHNVLQVDDLEQSAIPPSRLFALPDTARCRVETFKASDETDRLVASHDGFSSGRVRRTFQLDHRARALCLIDEVEGAGEHRLVVRFHLPDEAVTLRAPTAEELQRAGDLAQAPGHFAEQLAVLGPVESPRALILVERGVRLGSEAALYSAGYGESKSARVVIASIRRTLPGRVRTVILGCSGVRDLVGNGVSR